MTTASSANNVIFSDDFNTNGVISAAKWDYNHWNADPSKNGSFYGNTQQRQVLPSALNGSLRLRLDTFNPTDPNGATFLGSEAITKQTFSVGTGLAFEARARYAQDQAGIIGGFFTFAGPADHHDEIDFEALSNDNTQIQTNIYHNEPLGEGHPLSYPVTGSLTDYHIYRIEWLPNEVRWLVDGVLVRTETQLVPDKAMAMHLNIWGPPASWPTGSASLKPVGSASQDQTFEFWVDSVKVEQLPGSLGTSATEVMRGTGRSDWIDGQGGHDQVYGGGGNDTILGGTGHDTLFGQSGRDHLMGGNGQDSLNGGAGNDVLSGGAGRDQVTGGAGADKLEGGAGADAFVYSALSDSTVDSAGRDRILDFTPARGDRIDLSALDANTALASDQAFTFVGASGFSGVAGELQARNVAGRTLVAGDVNGDGVADFMIQLKGVIPITATDFVL
jgi:Ca2+-binding RTX toxin-like protein